MLFTSLEAFLALLLTHFAADFMLQTPWQAANKSSNNYALAMHVYTYTIALLFISPILFGFTTKCLLFCIINGMLHFATDYYTSRLTKHLWSLVQSETSVDKKGWAVHNFFVAIGLDQLIHQFCLASTMLYLLY